MIRHFTMINRDASRSIFLNFIVRVKELVISDCRFEICIKNCIYSQLEMSRILICDPVSDRTGDERKSSPQGFWP
jgi:hypothetical protein